MKNSNNFFYNYFLSIGIVWLLCSISILIFELHFQEEDMFLTIIIPLAFAVFVHFRKNELIGINQEKKE